MGSMKATLIFCMLILVICSCGTTKEIKINIPNDFQMTNVEVAEKIPLRAGLYISPSIKNFEKKGGIFMPYVMVFSFPIGDAMSIGCEKTLRNIFRNVVLIDRLDSDLSKKDIDVLIIPELSGLIQERESARVIGPVKPVVHMVMKWKIVSTDGKNIYFNTIKGGGTLMFPICYTLDGQTEVERNSMLFVMKDLFQKSQDDIYSNAWWKNPWWKKQ